jgi:hypothetical protein
MKAVPRTKDDFYRRYVLGEFGNKPRTWASYEDLRDDGHHGLVCGRDMEPGGKFLYRVHTDVVRKLVEAGDDNGPRRMRFNEAMPDEDVVLQGNVWHDGQLRLEYSRQEGISHREAVRQPHVRQAEGLLAVSLLRTFLDPSSYDDIQELLDDYEGAIIEFSAYGRKVGLLHRNTVIWEVRGY